MFLTCFILTLPLVFYTMWPVPIELLGHLKQRSCDTHQPQNPPPPRWDAGDWAGVSCHASPSRQALHVWNHEVCTFSIYWQISMGSIWHQIMDHGYCLDGDASPILSCQLDTWRDLQMRSAAIKHPHYQTSPAAHLDIPHITCGLCRHYLVTFGYILFYTATLFPIYI